MASKKKGKDVKSKAAPDKKRKAAKRAPKKEAKRATAKNRSRRAPGKSTKASPRARPRATRIYDHQEGAAFEPEAAGLRAGGQSGDLQGLRDIEGADSESVTELLEEGNTLEADVVAGVEHADDNEGREVHTHEVPEDDVPEEYRDKDS